MELLTSVALGLGLGLAYLVYCQVFKLTDSREPPVAPGYLPVVGHAVQMTRYKFEYLVRVARQTRLPVFTIFVPGSKMYVVTTPQLIQAVQKRSDSFAFLPIAGHFACLIGGVSPEARAIANAKLSDDDDGSQGYARQSQAATLDALKPGAIDEMNRVMLAEIQEALEKLSTGRDQSRNIGLVAWLTQAITLATTRSVYGPLNPFADPDFADAFWQLENNLMPVILGILPSITAKKPIAARERMVQGFKEYYSAGGHRQASAIVQDCYQAGVDHGVSLEDIARFELVRAGALFVNTAPAAFWLLFMVHAVPGLRDPIRAEIDSCTKTPPAKDGAVVKLLEITSLKDNCPLLLSTYQEVLRYTSKGSSIRQVMDDVYLDNYLLKKGALLQMPSRVVHNDHHLWGADAAEFNPYRFLAREKKNRPPGARFRAFGGGKTLCPGRHFATNEILAVAALFIARYDLAPVKGAWEEPTCHGSSEAPVLMEPDYDVEARLRIREGFEGVEWNITMKTSSKSFGLVLEDEEEV